MRDKVEQQLKCLQAAGIIEPIQSSDLGRTDSTGSKT